LSDSQKSEIDNLKNQIHKFQQMKIDSDNLLKESQANEHTAAEKLTEYE
jgi:hypothetical protein